MAVNLYHDRCFGPLMGMLKKLFGFSEPVEEDTIKGFVVLQKKNVLILNDFRAGLVDSFTELLGKRVSLQLVSTTSTDPGNGSGKLGEPAFIQKWISTGNLIMSGESKYQVDFKWDSNFELLEPYSLGIYITMSFFLKSLTIEIPQQGNVHFVCNSWIYPFSKYKTDRIFFSYKSYLPVDTPLTLIQLRNEELQNLRGNGTGKREYWDRIYDYDVYNDLGDPDKGNDYKRPVLGGSEFPYPRRGRTGRLHNKNDPDTESRLCLLNLHIYVPRDERFRRLKMSDFLANGLKTLVQISMAEFQAMLNSTLDEFDSFEKVKKLYTDGKPLPANSYQEPANNDNSLQLIKAFFKTDGGSLLWYPKPQVIAADEFAWRKDEEFARQMLSGLNPLHIRRLQFPPRSNLEPGLYGPQESSITAAHIQHNLDGLSVEEAIDKNKLFILDHHDTFMPYLSRINALSTKAYASRTILFLCNDDTLKPVAIELSLPSGLRRVFTPAEEGVSGALWQLAKAHVTVNDSGYHELISHWLRTHAVIEPFIIATNRNLSVLHPLHKLLTPHFRDTMNINALARHTLINAGGILERTVFPQKYALEMSAVVYKNWRFDDESLPADLLKRGMAEEDKSMPHGLRLMIQDYPYAVDGLDIWCAIQKWVQKYVSIYYNDNDELVRGDTELQAWWYEIRNVGHADKKDETWWYKMDSVAELEKALTTIIWVASALHAATNFGQYAYSGYMPNRPAVSRRLIPEEGSQEFSQLAMNPEAFFLKTVSNQIQTTLGIGLIEILSRYSTEEVYLGQRETGDWTDDKQVMEAFESFTKELKEIEVTINKRNANERLKNRSGPAKVPYTLLFPSTSDFSKQGGLNGRGIPNSISI